MSYFRVSQKGNRTIILDILDIVKNDVTQYTKRLAVFQKAN